MTHLNERRRTGAASELVHYSHLPRARLAAAVASGELRRVARGWYTATADPAVAPWDEGRRIARDQVLALGRTLPPDLVISGVHAALVHGAAVPRIPHRVEVIGAIPASTTKRADHYRRVVRHLHPQDVCDIDGILVTSPVRTAVEVARSRGPSAGLVVADSLLGLRFDDYLDREDRAVGDLARARFRAEAGEILAREPRLRGNGAARAVIAAADGRARTPIESEARRGCLALGLPPPVLQRRVVTDRRVVFPDLTFEVEVDGRLHVIHVETDGEVKYQMRIDRDAEREREDAIRRLGHRLTRLSGWQVTHECEEAIRRKVLPLFPARIRDNLRPVQDLDERVWMRRGVGRE